MKFDLFMRTIGQEYDDVELAASANRSQNYNNKGHRQRLYSPSKHKDGILTNVRMRNELFGGLLYDMDSKAVFLMDHEATKAVQSLLAGETFQSLAARPEFRNGGINLLREALFKYGLCKN